MYIEFIKSPSGAPLFLGYFAGDKVDIEDAVAKDLIDQGFAKPAKKAETATSNQAEKAEKAAK